MHPSWIPTSRPGLVPREGSPEKLGEKLKAALYLHETALRMMRQNLRRRNPELSEEDLQQALHRWLWTRPGAEQGDGWGRPRSL